ncbi:MAG: hypothetical protein IKL33_03355, partial [Alphaproteobacteria bacterium]|nr:hypothetical protein [Alphaproteobacteria bacterium]
APMLPTFKTFYYSRKKLGAYLVFNIILLTLAVLFTLTVFPDYPSAYYFALISCAISLTGALFVFLARLPLAIITPECLKIDRNKPLLWGQITGIKKIKISKFPFSKSILRIETIPLKEYRYSFMQKISAKSEFGAFSIPLYAMSKKDAKQIERIIRQHTIHPDNRAKHR